MPSSAVKPQASPPRIIEKTALDDLIQALQREGYQVIGPVVEQEAIVYRPVTQLKDLALGWIDVQEAGSYRLERDEAQRFFAFTVGPQSWKAYLFPPREEIWKARRENGRVLMEEPEAPPRLAFLGVRACELAAIHVQDRIFLQGPYVQPRYARRREAVFIIAVQCTRAGNTCFCVSMGTGPHVREGYDLALTELEDTFLVHIGSEKGAALMVEIPHREATQEEVAEAMRRVDAAAASMGRTMDTTELPELMRQSLESPHWEEVGKRCLACANCTLVCPTCFCFTLEDVTDLTGQEAVRVRLWDSCFNQEFTYTAGRPIRVSIASRYRQWLTHKLGWWVDQFGVLGCVGCGRCITWCPVGIDLTVEVQALRHLQEGRPASGSPTSEEVQP